MKRTLGYTPTSKQQQFHRSAADEVLYGGAAGGGKSKAVVMEAIVDGLEHPGLHSYLFRRSYPELRDTLIREALASLPPGIGEYRAASHDLHLRGGSVLHFRYCASMEDCYRYQGTEMARLYIDELTHFTHAQYDYLKTRVRVKKSTGVRPRIRCTANPGGVGHSWVKSHFIDRCPPGEIYSDRFYSQALKKDVTRTLQYIPATARENPHMGEEYIVELESKPEKLRRALLWGDWNAFDGQVFEEFTDNPAGYHARQYTHVIAPFAIPRHFQIYRGFDWGYTRPFSVGYWAKSPDGVLYRFFEIYGCVPGRPDTGFKWDPRRVAREVAKFERETLPGRKIIGIADPSIFDESRGEDGCISAIFAREGVYFTPGDNRRLPGKMQLHDRLRFDENGIPGLYIFNTCKAFLRTLPALTYDPHKIEDVDTSAEDHIYDETRYVLMANPALPGRATLSAMDTLGDDPLNLRDVELPANPYDDMSVEF